MSIQRLKRIQVRFLPFWLLRRRAFSHILMTCRRKAFSASASTEALHFFREALQVYLEKLGAQADPEKVAEYTYKKELFTSETEELKALPWYKNYRILAIILLALTAIIVVPSVMRGFEREIRKRLAWWDRLRRERGGQDR